MNPQYFERYQRQLQLQSFGLEGQRKLSQASVLIVGVGGLGCPAAQYLVGAGIGKVGLVDGDQVEIHNLHRQVLYSLEDIGKTKVKVAKQKLSALNPLIEIDAFEEFISPNNVLTIAENYDYILDGSDRFETRYLLDSYCTLKNKKYIYGSVFEFEGQVALFNYADYKVSYNSLFLPAGRQVPNKPAQSSAPTCSENGILGFLPGIIGCMQALEVVKHLCRLRQHDTFEMLHYDALRQDIYKTTAVPNSDYVPPKHEDEILSFDYDDICN